MTIIEFVELLARASPAVMLAAFIFLLFKPRGPLVLRRELERCEARHAEVTEGFEERMTEIQKDRDEYKAMVLRSLTLGERVVGVAERDR